MTHVYRSRGQCFATAVVALLSLGASVAAQAPADPQAVKPRFRVDPETGLPPGMPDFRGVWTNRWIVNMDTMVCMTERRRWSRSAQKRVHDGRTNADDTGDLIAGTAPV
jgi:hypothetical protein